MITTKSLAGMAILSATAGAYGQSIRVNINQQPVTFSGVGPQSVNGRVLVPLRGVLERLGALVEYDSSRRTVSATRGNTNLDLTLGQREARVNGRSIQLDVPAQTYRGTLLVPLRFVGEALGAEVRWDASSQTIDITAEGAPQSDPNNYTPNGSGPGRGGEVQIESFDTGDERMIRAGSSVEFTLVGSPGGIATLQIPGVSDDIPMTETRPGRYQARFTPVENGKPVTLSKAVAIARLRVGNREKLIQAGNPITIDTQAPVIDQTTPANGRTNRLRPNVTATFTDGTGSGIEASGITLRLDDRDVTSEATATNSFIAYRPDEALKAGRHTARLEVSDQAGNRTTKSWTFDIVTNEDVIKSFTVNGGDSPTPGDVITATLVGEPGGRATFSIGKKLVNQPLTETSPGKYVGSYTVKRNDAFDNEIVTARLVTKSNEAFSTEAGQNLASQSGPPGVPRLTSPANDARVGKSVTVKGTAAKRSRVHVRIDYKSTLLGAFAVNGTLYDQVVETDEQGAFTTEPISLGGGLTEQGSSVYTLSVTSVGKDDKESEPVKRTFRR